MQKKPHYAPDTILVLTNEQGLEQFSIPRGTLAVVVNGKEHYPDLFDKMVDRVGWKCLDEDFVCVEWMTNATREPSGKTPYRPNGYFAKERFRAHKYSGVAN